MKKILMPILEAGAGHRMPALAVKDAIEALCPGKYQIDIIDFACAAGAKDADRRMKGFWDFCLAHPWWPKFLYAFMEVFPFGARCVLPVGFGSFIRKGREYLRQNPPDIIFSPHYFSLSVAAMARDKLKLPVKVLGYVTDPFDCFNFWSEKRADMILVASERARMRALALRIPPERVKIFPFPINKKFFEVKQDRASVLRQLGLDPGRKTILTSMGGQGIGPVSRYIEQMCMKGLMINIIAVCGRNEAMKKRLEEFRSVTKTPTALKPLGFVSNMNELLSASDLCIAKAGASTTFETLFMKVPTIFTSYAVQSEKPNAFFCVDNGLGWYAPNAKRFWKAFYEALSGNVLAERKAKIGKLNLDPNGARLLAEYLISECPPD
jgi:UDP-N-acetylglucosamine:LPS N-acetylglucosamine transferase